MKKFTIVLLLLLVVYIAPKTTKASHYRNFEQFNLIKGKTIDRYSVSELNKHYKNVDRSKFYGWNHSVIGNRLKATFIGETLFSYYNNGYTAIDYTYKAEEQITEKTSYSSTGSIGINGSINQKGFKGGLDSSLKIQNSKDYQRVNKESYQISLKVDPGTQINLYTYGEGYLTNGVAAKYVFWFRIARGGFEYFEISSLYYRLEKIRI